MTTPLVSVLVVTENRHAFIPWLLWNFTKQTHQAKELVVVDSSENPVLDWLENGPGVHVLFATPGDTVGDKFTRAINAANGDVVMLWGDDDWQHPKRIEWTVEALEKDASLGLVGWNHGWYLDLWKERASHHRSAMDLVASTVGVRAELAKGEPFDSELPHASDTRWLRRLEAKAKAKILPREQVPSLWLVHGTNMSRRTYAWTHTLEAVSRFIEPVDWAGTPEQLENLRGRLK